MWTLMFFALIALLLVNIAGLITHQLSKTRYVVGTAFTVLIALALFGLGVTTLMVTATGIAAAQYRKSILSFVE
jgi:hypothetical protein